MEDAKQLRRYAQSAFSKHHTLEDALGKAKGRFKHWEQKAKAGIERIAGAGKERDEAKEDAQLAQLGANAACDAKARVEDNLGRVQDALVVPEEARRKAKAEVDLLEVERTSLLMEIRTTKDKVSSLHSQAGKDKATMEEDYQKALELILPMVTNVIYSNTIYVVINQKFQMACPIPPTHFL